MTYPEWIQYHAALFGFPDGELLMLAAWCEFFHAEGASADELHDASRALARDEKPAFRREDQLNLLGAAVRRTRKPALSRDDFGECGACGSTGWIGNLPHPRTLRGQTGGLWYTCIAFCGCALGRWKRAHWNTERHVAPMTFEEYETEFPNWRQDVAWWNERKQKQRGAAALARQRDETHGELPGRMARRLAAELAQGTSLEKGD